MEAPEILKGGSIARTEKRSTKDLSKAVLKKVNQKAPREGWSHRKDPKKSTKVLSTHQEAPGRRPPPKDPPPQYRLEAPPKEALQKRSGPQWCFQTSTDDGYVINTAIDITALVFFGMRK